MPLWASHYLYYSSSTNKNKKLIERSIKKKTLCTIILILERHCPKTKL